MGFMDLVEHLFRHDDGHTVRIGQPLSLRDAKTALAMIAVHQPLADMRKVADAVKQLQDEFPQYATYAMTHYYNEPKRVRFQSEGGTFLDADAIATAFAQSTVLRDEATIQHLIGDIADNREHRDPDATPAVPVDAVADETATRLAGAADARRAWLFALYDQSDDIEEATKGGTERLRATLERAVAHVGGTDAADTTADTDKTHAPSIARLIVTLLFPAQTTGAATTSSATTDAAQRALADPDTPSDAYMAAVQVFRDHSVAVPDTVTLER